MTTAILVTVLSILREPNWSLDVFDPCILDRDNFEGSLASDSCGPNIADLPEDPSHLIGDVSLVTRNGPLHPTNVGREQERPGLERQDPSFSRTSTALLRSRETLEARTLHARIGAVEDRCARHRQELQELTRRRPEPSRAHGSSDGRVVGTLGLSFEPHSQITSEARQRRRRSTRSAGLPTEPRISPTKRSRQRALDLDISGTPKFQLNSDNNTGTRAKLVRLQNRWRRVERR
jgi:hypothetical protein